MFKLFGLLLVGVSIVLAIEYPLYHQPGLIKHVEVEAPAQYDFSYSVHDESTGDIKSQTESRKGDVVHGQYTLIDADGFLRTVDYTSDAQNGFNAVVRRDPLGHNVKAIAPVAKVLVGPPKLLAAPKFPLPLAYH